MKWITSVWIAGVMSLQVSVGHAADINLFDWAVNIDGSVSYLGTLGGTVTPDPLPAGVDASGFNSASGLGALTTSITGTGSHFMGIFFDHEIDEPTNTYFNENGSVSGTAATGQSWEIDEPGFTFGDIYTNFDNSALDGSNNVPAGLEDDVSVALGWDFSLGLDEIAIIDMLVSLTQPVSGFYLAHSDPDSQKSIYFSSTLRVVTQGVPAPATLWLCAMGLLAWTIKKKHTSQIMRC